jgi:hypothetical protein
MPQHASPVQQNARLYIAYAFIVGVHQTSDSHRGFQGAMLCEYFNNGSAGHIVNSDRPGRFAAR